MYKTTILAPDMELRMTRFRKEAVIRGILRAELRTVNEYVDAYYMYLQTHCKRKTYYEYRYHLNNFVLPIIGGIYPETLYLADTDGILEYVELLRKSLTIKHRAMSCTRGLFKWLKRNGVRLSFDYRDITLPKIPSKIVQWLSEEEISTVRETFKGENLASLRTRALIELLLATGLRIAEACSINIADVNWNDKEIRVMGKGSKEGIVYFTDKAAEWLQKYLKSRTDDCPALFISGRGRLLTISARNYLRIHTKDLILGKKIHHHLFRKSFVTHLIRRGADIGTVQVLARHESPRTTLKHYIGVDYERAKVIHQKLLSSL